ETYISKFMGNPSSPTSSYYVNGTCLILIRTTTKNLHRMWAFPTVLRLSIAMVFSVQLSIQQINGSSIYQYLWSWTVNNDCSLEFGYLIDPLTSIMLILITTVGILILIYIDGYMSRDEGYLRFFVYISLFNTSMLGLVTSSNLIKKNWGTRGNVFLFIYRLLVYTTNRGECL
uniref:NADH-Ubiquinone oxidoreductase (complex I) chain 5 N-terminal domain-containing protein n=1 Tax=Aegilops tauschii subsp. strangulata TaxID=200361 RepID=A0A453LGQ4_AEGTS